MQSLSYSMEEALTCSVSLGFLNVNFLTGVFSLLLLEGGIEEEAGSCEYCCSLTDVR